MNSQASPDGKPRRSAVNKGQVWSAADMGDVHSNPLPYLLNLQASSFPSFRSQSSDLHGSQLLSTCRTWCLDTVRKYKVCFIPGWPMA
ncbi:hypothetical protein T11_7841 [Trichinella zimbabwensis]|uniref:Uncharacterized protein n=1 Tax=Trichinella zimbabwensis TaxID=268475 RepID=A0A0V1I5F0_9BILA|nr:hypothetical protein T11_7841 [Trichinella zimbabwensis]